MTNQIMVTSNVARDFLQNAAYFNTLAKVIWEYVSNSLDNPEQSHPVSVVVEISRKRVLIEDNGAGMSRDDLQRFFQMHGENIQRARGKTVRGRFGTGKCAAFGIANSFRVRSVRAGLLNVVELQRHDIENARAGEPFPVRDVVVDERTSDKGGTIIEITDLQAKNLDIDGAINYVERHLGRHQQAHSVLINNHLCEYDEPPFVIERIFATPPDLVSELGVLTLIVKVSPTPLEPETNGIDIISHGIWHETTLAGLEGKDMAKYLFGEVDVPVLEDANDVIAPFDNTRSNRLNLQNHRVTMLLGWISECLEQLRSELVSQERQRRQSDEAKRLRKEADQIADLLNADFRAFQQQIVTARESAGADAGPVGDLYGPSEDGTPLPGSDGSVETGLQPAGNPHGEGDGGGQSPPEPGPEPRSDGPSVIEGSETGHPESPAPSGKRRNLRGGFQIDFRSETEDADRSHYEKDTRTIVINLDHPQVAGAAKGTEGTQSREFRNLAYEIAFVEYALALPYELATRLEYYDAMDALYEARAAVNRITRSAAAMA